MRRPALAAVVLLVLAGAGAGTTTGQPANPTISYDAFIRLDPDERLSRFRELDAEHQALLVRTHAERWLEANRARLTHSQIAALEENIAFVTAETFQVPADPERMTRELRLLEALECQLGRAGVIGAFALLRPELERELASRTWNDIFQEWLDWLVNCVAR